MKNKPVLLVIRDGWGVAKADKYNAVTNAKTPNVTKYLENYPHCLLDAAGSAVGLPGGFQGSSEVGHLNMGAGRIVVQELKRIMDMIEDGSLFQTKALKAVIDNCIANNSALHLMGLMQDEGVHAHQDHVFAIMKKAKEAGVNKIYIHFFADGRDTPPQSALTYVKQAEAKFKEYGVGQIGTVMGRYFSMDRSEAWNLIDQAYQCLMGNCSRHEDSAEETIKKAYLLKNPDGSPMSDEYIPPTIIGGFKGIMDGDGVVHCNFRQDRAIELTKAFVDDDYPGKRSRRPKIVYCGLTRYYDSFKFNALTAMDEEGGMEELLGEVISKKKLKQLRLAETQKFKHVTSFFNGKRLAPYEGEDRIEIKGVFDPSSYAEHPEMNAYDVAEEGVKQIESKKYDLVVINFANCDMVGHTGNFEAAVKAVEVTDECTGKVTAAAVKNGYSVIIAADHGNAEEMWDYKINLPKTSHTCNNIHCILVDDDLKDVKLIEKGILSDIAPTVLEIMGIEKPAEMKAKSIIK